jgi:phosphoribosylformimino-5-aminoimidazole carboxamide ribotide isomerase
MRKRMQMIPAVDVLGGEVVRLAQGDYRSVTRYDVDPVAVASGFVAEGATLVHVVDLEAARGGECALEVVERLGVAGVPFQFGGGVRSASVARTVMDLGADRVVIGSALVSDAASAKEIVQAVGHGAVVGAVDVRDGRVRGSGWLDEGIPLAEVIASLGDLGIERALVTGIEKDGMMGGPSLHLYELVRSLAPDLTLIASGGVGSLEDLQTLGGSRVDFEGVIVGRALYEGRFSLADAIEVTT